MNCKPCGKTFTGIVPYSQHVGSEKHKRKVSSLNLLGLPYQVECAVCHISFNSVENYRNHPCKKQSNILNDSNLDGNSSDVRNEDAVTDHKSLEPSNKSLQYTECKICNKKFSGSVLYETHIESASHKKKVDAGNNVNTFSCDPCKKIFSGPEPYKQHLASASHKKKTEIGIHSEVVTAETFSCEACKKVFTGKVPYEQHLNSNVHKKTLKLIGISEQKISSDSECNPPIDTSNINKRWFCKFCHIQCSGLIPYKQHLEGDLHFKNAKIPPKAKAERSSTSLDESNEESIAVSTAVSPGNTEVDLSQAPESPVIADDHDNFISDKKIDADIPDEEKEDLSKENGQEDILIDKDAKSESYVKCKLCMLQLLNKEDALSHECAESVSNDRKSVKRSQSVKKEEESVKKLRSS